MKLNAYFIIMFISLNFLDTICLANRELVDYLNSIKGIPKFEYAGDLIVLKEGQVDLSVLIEHTETLLRQSDYQNNRFIRRLSRYIDRGNEELCLSLPSDQINNCFIHAYDATDSVILRLNELQANRILLPDNYYSIGELPEDITMIARGKLQSNCLNTCRDNDIGKVLSHGSISRYRQTVRKLTELGPSCLKMALYSLGQQLTNYNQDLMRMKRIGPPENCEQETGLQKNICKRLKRDHEQITQRISDLADLVISQNSSGTTLSLNASCLGNNSSISTIDRFFKNLKDEHDCSEYQPGEEREFYPEPFSGYKVKKEADGSYTVSMAMEFSSHYLRKAWESSKDMYRNNTLPSSHIFDSASYQNQVHNLHMQKITECIDRANVKMLGPNGEQLNIVITDGKEDTCTPKHYIQIHRYLDRANSANYPEDIDCPTMAHEVLHNAGLVDEYKERWDGQYVFINNGEVITAENINNEPSEVEPVPGPPPARVFLLDDNCRVTQDGSIMSNQVDRWNMTFPGPMGIGGPIGSNLSDLIEDSLIDPTHFNAILYGTCEKREDVRIYRQCSTLAYMTSYQEGTSNSDCPSLKTECERQNILGKSREELQKEYNLLGLNLRAWNRIINKQERDLITLEQAAIQNGAVDAIKFGCSEFNMIPISDCKKNLRDSIRYNKQYRDELIQQQERLRSIMREQAN